VEIFRAAEAAFQEAADARRPHRPWPGTSESVGVGEGRFPAGSIVHVGDDWAADVVGAKEAGWRAAYLRVRPDSPLPSSDRDERVRVDLEIDRLADLRDVLLAGDGGR
jgi:hypothetical protein